MRLFEFDLRLPDGRIVTASARSANWPEAYSRACANIEQSFSLLPDSGIVCRSYRSYRSACEDPELRLAA